MAEEIRVLFVCVENARRSQMAEGFANALGKGEIEAFSAGSHPAETVDPRAIAVMNEIGVDISKQKPKSFKDLGRQEFAYLIMLGCKDVCPFFPAKEEIAWEIPDPKGKGVDEFKKIRDLIELKVQKLFKRIDLGDI